MKPKFYLFYLLSHLPMPVLYLLSNIVYLLVYCVSGYRRKVVRENLENAFPDTPKVELLSVEKKFYSPPARALAMEPSPVETEYSTFYL